MVDKPATAAAERINTNFAGTGKQTARHAHVDAESDREARRHGRRSVCGMGGGHVPNFLEMAVTPCVVLSLLWGVEIKIVATMSHFRAKIP